jgi:hypothetical protein
MNGIRFFGVIAAMLLMSQTWGASATHTGGLKATIKADEAAVHSAKEALDAAETAAGLTPTFPTHPPHAKPTGTHPSTTTGTATSPGQRIQHALAHVAKEIERVNKLVGQANLPSAVSSAAQTLLTDLNKLQTDLNSAEAKVGSTTTK